ncbi:uncharacterized protein LOC106079455 [Biomphalaria glabrata]|uniref:Uncharacterized protein LOC106079455 n=1 Tax=Biomphalaria glabrata TaxID=6526 RepID=A0A9W3BAQ7_BIOGL|nr:uncharacterized protein LOC106079455 [Biomphalaria glabrata]
MESSADNQGPTLTLLHNDLTRLEFISQKNRHRKGANTKRFSARPSSVPKVFPEHDLSSVTRSQFVTSSAKSMTQCTLNNNKKEPRWLLRHPSPTRRLRGAPKRPTDIPCTVKSCNNSASEAFIDTKMACRLIRSKHVLPGKELTDRVNPEAEGKNGVLSLKIDHSWKSVDKKSSVDEPIGNAKCELFHQLLSESVSSNSIPTLPKLSGDLPESTMQAIHKDLNQSSKKNLASGRWHNWMKTKYEPSFDLAKDRKAAPLLGPSGLNGSSCSSESDSSRPSSSLRAGELYSSCFPLLVKNYSQSKVHRRFPMQKAIYKNVPTTKGITSQRDDTSGKSPECSEKDDASYCSGRCCCDTFNCSNSCEAVHKSSLNLDSRSLKTDALQQCGVTESEDMPFSSRKLHRGPKASKDSRKLQKRHMASKVTSKLTTSRTVCLEQQDIVNCSNVWKSIIKSRDWKKSEVKSQCMVGAERNENSSTMTFESEKKRQSEDIEIEPPTEADVQSKEDSQPDERERKMGGKSTSALSTLGFESNVNQFKDLGSKTLKRNRRTFRSVRNYMQRYPPERDEIFFPFYRMLPQCTETPAAGGSWQTSLDSSSDLHKEGIEKEDVPSCNEDKKEQAEDTHQRRHTNDTTDNNADTSMNIAEHGRTTCGKNSCDESQSEFFPTRRSSDDEDVDSNSREMTEQHSTSSRVQRTNHDLAQEEVPDSVRWTCRVKGYEIIRHLVRGSPNSFSKLFLASNTYNPSYSLVEIISYKQPFTNILTSFYCNDATTLQRHRMRERSLAITLHKNLVTLLHRFCTEHMVYQVTEHIPWPTLTHLISTSFTGWVGALRKGLSENTRRSIFKQICHGIEHLHLLGIVHGGLNCNNVLVSDKLEVKLTDYGPACQRLALTYDPLRNRMLSRGNPYDSYTPPEMMSVTGSWTRSCDVWCIGIALLEMTLGEIPPSLIRTIRLKGNAKKIDKVNLENCGYQLSLLIDKILQSRPSQRPHVSALTNHAWLSDGTELALVVNLDAKKVTKRTDGSTFPLPKRLQNRSIPTSEAFYDSSDSESKTPVLENPVNCEDYYDVLSLTCAEKSCVCNECGWTMDVNPCGSAHSGSCIHSESNTSFEHGDKTSSESLGSGEDPNYRVASEGKAVTGFLSTLVASLDSSSSSNIESRSLTKVLKPSDKPWLRRGLVTGIPPQPSHSKKVQLSSCSPFPTHRQKSPRTNSSKSERFCNDSNWTKIFQSYLDSGDHKSNSFNYPNDDTPMTASTDCNDGFVLEGDDEALEEIENLIQQEERMFWGREFGKISQEAA